MMNEDKGGDVDQQPAAPSAPVVRSGTLFSTSISVLVMVVLAWALAALLTATRSGDITQLDAKSVQLDTQLKSPAISTALAEYSALDTVVTHMQRLRNDRFLFLPTWDAVKKSVPKDMQFTSFVLGEDSSVRITGVARSVTSVSFFANALAEQSAFRSVTPLSVDKQSGQQLYNFTITFKVAPPARQAASAAQSGGQE